MINFVSRYLLLLIIVPSIALVIMMFYRVTISIQSFYQFDDTKILSQFTSYSSALAHELQNERGMTAGYIGSNGHNFNNRLYEQQQITDKHYRVFMDFFTENKNFIDQHSAIDENRNLQKQLNALQSTRQKILTLDNKLDESLNYYTSIIAILIEKPMSMLPAINHKKIAQMLIATNKVSEIKETGGIQRALISNILASKTFNEIHKQKLYTLIGIEKKFMIKATTIAGKELLEFKRMFVNSKINQDVDNIREKVIEDAINNRFTVDPTDWFSLATKRFNELRKLEIDSKKFIDEYVNQQAQQSLSTMLMSLFIAIIIITISILTFIIMRRLKLQAQKIQLTLNDIGRTNNLTLRIDIITDDYLGKSADHINRTFAKIANDFHSIAKMANSAVSATHDTVVAVVKNEDNIVIQQEETNSVSSAVEELSVSIEQVSNHIDEAVQSIENAKGLTHNGHIAVREAVRHIEQVSGEMDILGDSISVLNKRIESISDFLEVIESVAEQTNLLALNAAIEAARAGEQGRGFAVVAEEVRNLAKRSKSSTLEISQIINSLKKDSERTTKIIHNGQNKTTKAVDSARSIEDVLSNIVSSVNTVSEMSREINHNASQQSQVTLTVADNVGQIEQMSQENLLGILEISESATQLSEVTTDLTGLISEYRFSDSIPLVVPSPWKYGPLKEKQSKEREARRLELIKNTNHKLNENH